MNPHEKALTGKTKGRAMKMVKNLDNLRKKGSKTMDIISKHSY